jgi:hypothetical protein
MIDKVPGDIIGDGHAKIVSRNRIGNPSATTIQLECPHD